jgi:sugar phosphate isomerase/epimerase
MTISYQLYSSRMFPPVEGTLTLLSGLGYTAVEGFGGLYPDLAAAEALRRSLDKAGLTMPTGHFGLDMVEGDPTTAVAVAKALGVRSVIVPYLMPDKRPTDAAGWAAFGTRLARAGAPLRDAGLTFGWHNHDFEVRDVGGTTPLDLILEASDDTKLELDLAWVVRGGRDPADVVDKWADRLVAAHIKDIAPAGQAADEDGWADVGYGTMDWIGLMTQLRGTPCSVFVMEHDKPNDHVRFATRSFEFLKTL